MKEPINIFGGFNDIEKLKAGLQRMKEELQIMLEYWEIDAKLVRGRFDALVKQGFTQEQALFLVKKEK